MTKTSFQYYIALQISSTQLKYEIVQVFFVFFLFCFYNMSVLWIKSVGVMQALLRFIIQIWKILFQVSREISSDIYTSDYLGWISIEKWGSGKF